jgi:alpha-amylase
VTRYRRSVNSFFVFLVAIAFFTPGWLWGNPWNGKVTLQAFWWDSWNENYRQDWYTYLAKVVPRIRALGFDGIWLPSPAKGNSGSNSMGYDIFDHYDLGEKNQKDTVATRFGDKDSLLRLIAVAHANGLEVYLDIVLNQVIGGAEDPDAEGDKFKRFRYAGFTGPDSGRWPKDHWNFHPNPDHKCSRGDVCEQKFGPDVCYLDSLHGGGGNGQYMRDQARQWFVWLTKTTGADGFRFDAVKHFEPYVVEDLLYNAMGNRIDYFAVGEFVGSQDQLDNWANETKNRSGTFDFPFREALSNIIEGGGLFDMGILPNYQQKNRIKTVPFINNHDTWRGAYWDSVPGSLKHDDRSGDWRQNDAELAPTIDPDNARADVAYAAAFAVDGSPVVFYEDLFVNYGSDRFRADPATLPVRDYIINLIWSHQKLNFKDGAYKVRYQESPDLLVFERSGKAVIGLNDHGSQSLSASVKTDFGPHVVLHDYSGSISQDLETDDHGSITVSVPPMSYVVWGPIGVQGGFSPPSRRTVQEFQLDDDLGDAAPGALGYGGKVNSDVNRTGGAIWIAAQSAVKTWVYSDSERQIDLTIYKPDTRGAKSQQHGLFTITGSASSLTPLSLQFTADREGYHQLSARIADLNQSPTRAYIKVEYEAPAVSDKF